jgi:hypothetical protein
MLSICMDMASEMGNTMRKHNEILFGRWVESVYHELY